MDQLDQVGRTDFGPLSVSWDGLSVRGRLLPWEDFGSLVWKADGISIVTRHGLHYWNHISTKRIPNPLCLRTTVVFFQAVRWFLSKATGALTTSPRDFVKVLRSVRGIDEFHLANENNLVAAMTEVVRYQASLAVSLQLEPSMAGFDKSRTVADVVVSLAWQELLRRVSEFVPIPARIQFLASSTPDAPIDAVINLLILPELTPPETRPGAPDATPSQRGT